MKVADLLEILNITKQSLGRVLKQLVDQGYVLQKEGESDRRQRLLYATPKGEALAMKLAGLQTERIARARRSRPGAHDDARRFLIAMIDRRQRDNVLQLIARADRLQDKASPEAAMQASGARPARVRPTTRRICCVVDGDRAHPRSAVALPAPAKAIASPPPTMPARRARTQRPAFRSA